MCKRQCLHSSMIGILCTASGCRLRFVVDRVEENVGEGGSRSC